MDELPKPEESQNREAMLQRAREISSRKRYGIQFNTKPGEVKYAASRDFAYNYPQMVAMVRRCFNEQYWPRLWQTYFSAAAALNGWDQDRSFVELDRTNAVYYKFLNECWKDSTECCDDVLERVGWNELDVLPQVTWLAMLGQVITGQLFSGIRDLYLRDDESEPAADIDVLLEAGNVARRYMNHISPATERRDEVLKEVRQTIRQAREFGLSFDEIHELVDDIKLGRVN